MTIKHKEDEEKKVNRTSVIPQKHEVEKESQNSPLKNSNDQQSDDTDEEQEVSIEVEPIANKNEESKSELERDDELDIVVQAADEPEIEVVQGEIADDVVVVDGEQPFEEECKIESEADETTTTTAATNQNYNIAPEVNHHDHHQVEFPSVFYCAITKKLMKDPVVNLAGDSVERSAVMGDDNDDAEAATTYYPNRALKAIIDKALQERREAGTLQGKLRNLDENIRSGWSQLVEKASLPTTWGENKPLHEALYCPITYDLMYEPVIDKEGNTFERVSVENWILFNNNSPITRTDLCVADLRPNNAIKHLLDLEKQKPEEIMNPTVKRWKDGSPPEPIILEYPEQANSGTGTIVQIPPNMMQYPTDFRQRRRRQQFHMTCTMITWMLLIFILLYTVPLLAWMIFFTGIAYIVLVRRH